MSERVPCKVCGASILVDTAQRTSGFCMPCSKDPSGRSACNPPPPPPGEELLSRLRIALTNCLLDAARSASRDLASEQIYGFALYHGQFLYAGATVFTEVGLGAKLREYQARGHNTTLERLRWSPCDSPHHMYCEGSFAEIEEIFTELDRHTESDFSDEIERIFLRCLEVVRNARVFNRSTLITLMEGDQSNESRFAYAERFNPQEVLERFRAELTELDEERLAHCRSAIPTS